MESIPPSETDPESNCPSDGEILAVIQGEEIEREDYARVVEALTTCRCCQERLEELTGKAGEIAATDEETLTIVQRIKKRGRKSRSLQTGQVIDFLEPLKGTEEGLGRIGKYRILEVAG